MLWKQRPVEGLGIAVVNQNDDAAVGIGANHPSRRLQNAVHAGEGIGVVVSSLGSVLVILPKDGIN